MEFSMLKFIRILFLAILSVVAISQAAAQDTDYVIGVDDVISISVISHEGMDKEVTVLADGTIAYPFAGTLKAAGKTAKQLQDEIKVILEKTRNNVDLSVTVKEVRSRKIRIVGPVKSPGAYDLKAKWRVLDIIASAGGLNVRPSQVTARIIRGGEVTQSIDIVKASLDPESADNPELMPNDLVLLDEKDPAMNKVFVMGQVGKPGAYEIGDNGTNIIAILSLAGNATDKAALARVSVMRGTQLIPINLEPVVTRGQMTDEVRNFVLQAGDVLFIPEIDQRISIMGQVNRPGQYPMPEAKDLTVLDALSMAGGQTQIGDLGKAGIIRMVEGQATVVPVNIDGMLRNKNLAANIKMVTGDVLYIPTKNTNRFEWKDVLGPLSLLSFFGIKR
jgi:protein involved in polysaccharide export with SLBB domain